MNYTIFFIDPTLSTLSEITDKSNYLYWLYNQEFPEKSYLKHPLKSEEELDHYKKYFEKNHQISLGAFIRMKRIFHILNHPQNKPNDTLFYSFIETPLGLMLSVFSEKGLCLLEFLDRKMLETELNELIKKFNSNLIFHSNDIFFELKHQLNEYFNGKRKIFDIPLDLVGTDFQIQVWQELLKIPFGETLSYGLEAEKMGNPNATRAVASANGKNKISIIVPCHRVINKNGSFGGYGGGIERKKFLLQLESVSSTNER